MPDCVCPICGTSFSTPSPLFGEKYRCNACGSEYMLDIQNLARYELPSAIHIQLRDSYGAPFTKFPVPVMIDYGYHLPPLLSNSQGQIGITRDTFMKAQRDEISTGIMDYKGDFALNHFIRIRVLEQAEALRMAQARSGSGWPILDFEKELYGDMPSLIAAYVPSQDIVSVEAMIDLAQRVDPVSLEIIVVSMSFPASPT